MARDKQNQFRPNTFDPILIIAQIMAYQSWNYLSLSLLILAFNLFSNINHISLNPIFNPTTLTFGYQHALPYLFLFLLNTIPSMLGLMIIIERAKLCLDFVLTYQLIHLLFTIVYTRSFPISLLWWLNFLLSTLIITLGGEYLCYHYETKPIQLSGTNNRVNKAPESEQFIQNIAKNVDQDLLLEEGLELNLLNTSSSRD
ncbi:hypothetical protein K502DRAFT_161023 [Neoconidiobolus thromboides FSU 785]|nr:hypothetical protein K502DRAFT_161023 [Neoconidiobolus thromboides FSU 785]